jgi:hypothetical protein
MRQRRIVAVYPGRFQPMLPHHLEVFLGLERKYGEAVIVTSSKTGADSPFTFNEKAAIAKQMYGIGSNKIVQAASPYNIAEYARALGDDVVVVVAVGEKDMQNDPRLPKGDRPVYKKNGELAALQPLEAHEGNLRPVSQHAYVTVAPTVMTGNRPASASAFRKEFQSAHDDETAKEVFRRYFGKYNEATFQLVNSKLRENQFAKQLGEIRQLTKQEESNMKTANITEINQIRQLAGLPPIKTPVTEALVDYDGDINDEVNFPVDAKSSTRTTDPVQLLNLAKRLTLNPPILPKDYDILASFIEQYRGLGSGNLTQQSRALSQLASRSTPLALVLGVLQSRFPAEFTDLSLYLENLATRISDGEQIDNNEGDIVKTVLARSVNQGFWKKLFNDSENVVEMKIGLDSWRVYGEDGEVEFVQADNEADAVRKITLELPYVTWLHAEKVNGEMAVEDNTSEYSRRGSTYDQGSADAHYDQDQDMIEDSSGYDERHGGPFDRGTADSYYRRPFSPHYYVGATAMSERVEKESMTPEEIAAYRAGYEYNEEYGDFKDYR